MSPVVRLDVSDGIATLTFDRPEALNALNSEVLDAVCTTTADLAGRDDVSGILLTGKGKAFVAGADIAEMADYGPEQAEAFSRRGQEAFQHLADFPGPVVAAINGFALGGGLEVALGCDILIASTKAKLGLPETTLGVIPGFGGTQRLPRRVGPGHAKRLMFTGAIIGAQEALQIGLVDLVADPDELIATARTLLAAAAKNGPLAVQSCKRLIDAGLEMPLDDAISMEASAFGQTFATADQKEGMQAFLDKRPALFVGA